MGRSRPTAKPRSPTFTLENGAIATRDASAKVLNAIASQIPELMGGAAQGATAGGRLAHPAGVIVNVLFAGATNTAMKVTGSVVLAFADT